MANKSVSAAFLCHSSGVCAITRRDYKFIAQLAAYCKALSGCALELMTGFTCTHINI